MSNIEEMTLLEIYNKFVSNYETENIRNKLFYNFKVFTKQVCEILKPDYIWIGGSFVTDKHNPNDIDIVMFFDFKELPKNKYNLKFLIEDISKLQKIHGHIAFSDLNTKNLSIEDKEKIVNLKNKWQQDFSKDSNGTIVNSKIIVQINKEEIVKNIYNCKNI